MTRKRQKIRENMKIKKVEITQKELDIQAEISLLTKEEYERCKEHISEIYISDNNLIASWWLRTPTGKADRSVYFAEDKWVYEGSVNTEHGIRPALYYKNGVFEVGDQLIFGGFTWTIIESGIALCDDIVCSRVSFSNLFISSDNVTEGMNLYADDYEKSNAKACLDEIVEEMTNNKNNFAIEIKKTGGQYFYRNL